MTQPDPAKPPSSNDPPTMGQAAKKWTKEAAKALGVVVLQLAAGLLLAVLGIALAVAGLVAGSTLMLYAGAALLVAGVIWVILVWSMNDVPWI